MADEKDQELDKASAASSTVDKDVEETSPQVDGDGAEGTRALKNRDEIITRLQKQRDRDRDRMTELETRIDGFQTPQQQPSQFQQAPQPESFNWQDPDGSIDKRVNQAVTRAVAAASTQTRNTIRGEAQMEKAREFMEGQRGYNATELKQVFEENPDISEHLKVNPLAATKLAVKIWRIEKGDTDSFKKEAAAGISPSAMPTRQKGHAELFSRVKEAGEKATDEDLDKAWGALEKLEKQGAKIS